MSILPLIAGGLLLLAWLLPNNYYPWVSAYNDFAAMLSVGVLGILLLRRAVHIPVSAGLFFFIALLPLLQWAAGVVFFMGDAVIASFYLIAFGFSIAVGRNVICENGCRQSAYTYMAAFLVLGAAISVWIALRQWLMLSGSIWVVDLRVGGRPFANMAQPNNLATLLCMGLAGVYYLFNSRKIDWLAAGWLAGFLIIGLVLTQSRTPWLGSLCALVWLGWKGINANLRMSFFALASWVVFYASSILLFPFLADAIGFPLSQGVAGRAQSLERLELWQQLWHALIEGSWWGYGWNQVSVAQVTMSLDYPVRIPTEHAHNILLDLLIWNGPLLGGLIIVWLSIWLVGLGVRARSGGEVFGLLVVGFVLVHGMLEFPLEYAFFLLPAGLLLGMVEGEQTTRSLLILPRWIFAGLLVVFVGVYAWSWQEYRVIEEDNRMMRFETARIGNLHVEHAAPDVVLFTQLREFIRFARTQATPAMSDEQVEWMRKIAYRYPYPSSLYRYSLALALNGRSNLAGLELLRLRGLYGEERYREARRAMTSMAELHPELAP